MLLLFALTACGIQNGPSPASATPPQETPAATPQLVIPTPAPTDSPTPPPPTATPTVGPTSVPMAPLLTAPALRIEGWSADGDWLAYWASSQEEVSSPFYPYPPGRLSLHNVQTGQECDYPELVASGEGDGANWQPDGKILVSIGGQQFEAVPCEGDFAPVEVPSTEAEGTSTPEEQAQAALAPGGSYQAETSLGDRSAGILNLTTTLLALPDRQVVNSVEWKIDERLGDIGTGGEWLAGNQFLIYETLEQGPLLITVSGEVIEVPRELFGIEQLPSLLDPQGVSLRAAGAAVEGTDTYHVVLYGVGSEANFPPVRLYHSEEEQVEEMPFRDLWSPAFSADGRWLLLDEHPIQNGVESRALWIRPVDPPGSEVRFFAAGSIISAWSPDGSKAAFFQPDSVSIYAFPDGDPLSSWGTGAFETQSLVWSPQGGSLAVLAGKPGEQQALFIIPNP